MNKFRDNTFFLEKVAKKDTFAVRSSLVNMIQKLEGKKELILEAIKYATDNDSFVWDDYDNEKTAIVFNSIMEEFSYEKEKLVNNFSEERFIQVIELYKSYLYEKEKANKIDTKSSEPGKLLVKNDKRPEVQIYKNESLVTKLIKSVFPKKN